MQAEEQKRLWKEKEEVLLEDRRIKEAEMKQLRERHTAQVGFLFPAFFVKVGISRHAHGPHICTMPKRCICIRIVSLRLMHSSPCISAIGISAIHIHTNTQIYAWTPQYTYIYTHTQITDLEERIMDLDRDLTATTKDYLLVRHEGDCCIMITVHFSHIFDNGLLHIFDNCGCT